MAALPPTALLVGDRMSMTVDRVTQVIVHRYEIQIVVVTSMNDRPRATDPWPPRNWPTDLGEKLQKFADDGETLKARRRRIAIERTRAAIAAARRSPQPEIPESQFSKPTRVRRACGGRWRVMHP